MIGVCSLNVNIGMSFNRAKQANLKQNTKNQHKINTYLHAKVYEVEARYNSYYLQKYKYLLIISEKRF